MGRNAAPKDGTAAQSIADKSAPTGWTARSYRVAGSVHTMVFRLSPRKVRSIPPINMLSISARPWA